MIFLVKVIFCKEYEKEVLYYVFLYEFKRGYNVRFNWVGFQDLFMRYCIAYV